MVSFRHLVTLPISIGAFVATFYVVGKLMFFLSMPVKIQTQFVWVLNMLDNYSRLESALLPMTTNTVLVIVFILQHSLMRSSLFSSLWLKLGLATIERSIYNLATAASLHFLLVNWKTVGTFILWQVDVEKSQTLWWTFVVTHGLAWSIIYGGSVLMDLPELLGLKQVFYDFKNLLPPMCYKSKQLRTLYSHIRHPSFVGLSVVLWAINIMSLDRLLLAVLWTLYMYIAWNTDHKDIMYHKCQLGRKRTELSYQQ